MTHGETVREFEEALAKRLGAKWAICMTNGTVTLEVALRALGVQPGEKVATTPLTMAATSIAILNVGAVPVYVDVSPDTWLAVLRFDAPNKLSDGAVAALPVSLYGLQCDWPGAELTVDDAAQTLRRHSWAAFTSYSFQRSKILNTGEGGALLTNSDELATKAREISSLGYKMEPGQSRIDSQVIRSPSYERHHTYPSLNARMNDVTAAAGLEQLAIADDLLADRRRCADLYRQAIAGVDWLTPQHVPEGWGHSWWTYAVAVNAYGVGMVETLQRKIQEHGGEVPYGAWRLTYQEPAFRALGWPQVPPSQRMKQDMDAQIHGTHYSGICPVAESLQPRLMQFQTNDYESAYWNALALVKAIKEIGG